MISILKLLKKIVVLLQKLETAGGQMHDEEALKVEKQVIQHFSQIHGLLIIEEEEILKKIRNAQNQTYSSLSNIVNELEVNIKVNIQYLFFLNYSHTTR